MFDYSNRRFAKRLVRFHTTTPLTDSEAMEENSQELIAASPKTFLLKQKLLEATTEKIDGLIGIQRKLNIYGIALSAILCSAILGIKLEVSLLGIKLEDFRKLNEFALVAFIAGNFFYDMIEYQLKHLEGLRKQISVKLYGEKNTRILELLYDRNDVPSFDEHIHSTRYSSQIGFLRMLQACGVLMSLLVVLVGFLALQWIIAYDVWVNSSIGYPWNRILVALFVLSLLSTFLSMLLRQRIRTKYRDAEKTKTFDKLMKEEGWLTTQVAESMRKEKKV